MNTHTLSRKFSYLLLLLFLLLLPSCEREDPRAEAWFSGVWYVTDYSYNCPYEYNDTFRFYPDGTLRVSGWSYERGYWEIRSTASTTRLYIYFVGDGYYPTIVGEFDEVGHSYIRLYVEDQDYGDYWLVLRRSRYSRPPHRDLPADSASTALPDSLTSL